MLPLRENMVIKITQGEAGQDFFAGPVSGLLNHFLLFGYVSEFEIMKLLKKSCLSGQLPARQRPERAALSAGADAAGRPGHGRLEPRAAGASGLGGARRDGAGLRETERQRCPARPRLTPGC